MPNIPDYPYDDLDLIFFLLTLCPGGWNVIKEAFESKEGVENVELELHEEWFGYYDLDITMPIGDVPIKWEGKLSRDPFGEECYEVAEVQEDEYGEQEVAGVERFEFFMTISFTYDGRRLKIRYLNLYYDEAEGSCDATTTTHLPTKLPLAPHSVEQDIRNHLVRFEVDPALTILNEEEFNHEARINGCLEARVELYTDLCQFLSLATTVPSDIKRVMAKVFERVGDFDAVKAFHRTGEFLFVLDGCPEPVTVRELVYQGRCLDSWPELAEKYPHLANAVVRSKQRTFLHLGTLENEREIMQYALQVAKEHKLPVSVKTDVSGLRLVSFRDEPLLKALKLMARRYPHLLKHATRPLISKAFYV